MTLDEIRQLFTADGQQIIFELIHEAQDARGAAWLDFIKSEYPNFCAFVDLVANHDAPAALEKLKIDYPLLRVVNFDAQLISLHHRLRAEIDRKF